MSPYDDSWNLDAQPKVAFHPHSLHDPTRMELQLRRSIGRAKLQVRRAEQTLSQRLKHLRTLESALARQLRSGSTHKR